MTQPHWLILLNTSTVPVIVVARGIIVIPEDDNLKKWYIQLTHHLIAVLAGYTHFSIFISSTNLRYFINQPIFFSAHPIPTTYSSHNKSFSMLNKQFLFGRTKQRNQIQSYSIYIYLCRTSLYKNIYICINK